MEIKFALNTSVEVENIEKIITEIENEINLILRGKIYGSDLIQVYVGWIYVAPAYDKFFKPRKPKFYEREEMSVDGRKYKLTKALEYELKLEYEIIKNESEKGIKFFIWNELIRSLAVNIKAIKAIKDFDVERLMSDLKNNI